MNEFDFLVIVNDDSSWILVCVAGAGSSSGCSWGGDGGGGGDGDGELAFSATGGCI